MTYHFKSGDRVRMKDGDNGYVHGEITIVRQYDCKVMFDEEWAPNYDYYLKEDLEIDPDYNRGTGSINS